MGDFGDISLLLARLPTNDYTTLDSGFTAPTLLNGWQNYGTAQGGQVLATAGYKKDAAGCVHLKGLVKNGVIGGSAPIFVLPPGMRPPENQRFQSLTYHTALGQELMGMIEVMTDGRVITYMGNGYVSLDSVHFMASGEPAFYPLRTQRNDEPLDLSLVAEAWTYMPGAPGSFASYCVDAYNRVRFRGYFVVPANAPGAVHQLAILPDDMLPADDQMLIPCVVQDATGAVGYGRLDLTPDGILALTDTGTQLDKTYARWVYLNGVSWVRPDPIGTGLGNMHDHAQPLWPSLAPLHTGHVAAATSGWQNYGAPYEGMTFSRDIRGHRSVHGVIRAVVGSTINFATVPVNYRTSETRVLPTLGAFNGSQGGGQITRVNVNPAAQGHSMTLTTPHFAAGWAWLAMPFTEFPA